MTVGEAYKKLGGNYEELCERINETTLLRLIGMLLRDTNYAAIRTALDRRDYESAFRGAHTLKGVALNLSLTPLAEKAGALAQALRDRQDIETIESSFAAFDQAYQSMRAILSLLPAP